LKNKSLLNLKKQMVIVMMLS